MVTGISSGIGRATAFGLGRRGFHVVGAGRSKERTMPVVEEIRSGGGSAEFLQLDLASLTSCLQAAGTFIDSGRSLQVLVNNAGVGGTRGVSADGFEIHFGVNHLGHFMLTRRLEPVFASPFRVVQVTSAAHFNVDGIDFDRVHGRTRSLFGWSEYGVSKLANVLFVRELSRRRPHLNSYAVHPGMTDTGIFPKFVKPFLRNRLFTPEQGAETVIWCASSEDVSAESGLYYRRRESRPPSEVAQDQALASELWERSERWCRAAGLEVG
jgi:retinol dehydrogenase-12